MSQGTVFTTLCALVLLPALGLAQSDTAQVSGFVRDSSDAVVPGASITVRNESVALERKTNSNSEGYFVVPNLPPGFYTVIIEAQGFKRFIRTGNKLDASMAASINGRLEVGSATESVEVVATAASLQTDSAAVGQMVERSQIENMMLNGRNAVLLANLKPGVQGGILSRFTFGLDNGGLSINGSRPQENLITYDGAPAVRTRANGTSIGTADLDNVQEVQILTADYNAEYGRANGGQIRIVTRSGGPKLHGSFYEYLRNSNLDANTWARNVVTNNRSVSGAPAPLRFNQFGYNISGPVPASTRLHNKVFWLWGEEWVRYRPTNTTSQTVPSLAMRRGDFSELLNPSNPFFGRARIVNDPSTGQPFPGNIIPAAQVSKNGLALLRAYPEPTPGYLLGTANWLANASAPTNQRKDTVSVDVLPTQNQSVRFRVQNFAFVESNPLLYNSDRVGMIRSRPNQVASLAHTWTISPNVVNEFLATGSVDRVEADIDRSMNRWDRTQYGIDFPYVYPGQKQVEQKIPWTVVAGFLQMNGGPYPARSAGPIYVVSDNLTKVLGQHTFKFGFLYEHAGQNNFDLNNANCFDENGCFSFTDARSGASTSGIAVANVALGLFTSYLEPSRKVYVPYRGNQWEGFAQDSWKVTARLRLEFGVRYSVVQPWYSEWNNQAAFDARYYDPAQAATIDRTTGLVTGGNRLNGMVITGSSWPDAAIGRVPAASNPAYNSLFRGASRQYSETHYRNFQPRLGIAWQVSDKTVVRGGFGKFLSRPGISDGYPMAANPPILNVASFTNGNVDAPGGSNPVASPYALGTQDPVLKVPAAYNWNLTVERQLPFATTVQVAYVGRVGLWGQRVRNINQLAAGTIPANPEALGEAAVHADL